jgi:hypothetical protein
VRSYLWRQWENGHNHFNELRRRGVSQFRATVAAVGVQLVSARYREDLCLAAGEAIEAGGTPSAPIDPTS